MRLRAGQISARVPVRHATVPVRFVSSRLLGGYSGLAAPWGVYISRQVPEESVSQVLDHELVHIDQWRRLGRLRFVARYGCEYVTARLNGARHTEAYLQISLEQEARGGLSR